VKAVRNENEMKTREEEERYGWSVIIFVTVTRKRTLLSGIK